MKIFTPAPALWLLLCGWTLAADLTSSGDWMESIDASDLSAGAGSDLISQSESASGVTVLDITNASGSWTLKARRSDNTWHGNFRLYVKRTSDGSGSGTIAGGSGYVELTNIDADLFTGTENRGNISLQLKLTGMSKNISPTTYSTAVIFTVTP